MNKMLEAQPLEQSSSEELTLREKNDFQVLLAAYMLGKSEGEELTDEEFTAWEHDHAELYGDVIVKNPTFQEAFYRVRDHRDKSEAFKIALEIFEDPLKYQEEEN